jgi:SAM-dependent methyltransferase
MSAVNAQQRDWDELASVDPLWAILSDPHKRGRRWNTDEFFATGRADIERAFAIAAHLGRPRRRHAALDFGCGVGRISRALADGFDQVLGVDISPEMIRQARELNREFRNVHFLVNRTSDLHELESGSFDLVYSRIVLQHFRQPDDVLDFVGEFLRLVRPDGLVVFQLPGPIPLRHRVQLRRRLWALLRHVGLSAERLHDWNLSPIRVIGLPEERVLGYVAEQGGTVQLARPDDASTDFAAGFEYYVTPRGLAAPPDPRIPSSG